MQTRLTAPFPYYGGKTKWVELAWSRFGEPFTYIEPFAGSLAMLLGNPKPAKREIVGDTHAAVCNFWRAVRSDPELVAFHASYPTFHQDLTARHRWLVGFFAKNYQEFEEDPEYYDAKAAGWWCWGMSNWIGGNFCDYQNGIAHDSRPEVKTTPRGRGTSIQRAKIDVADWRPHTTRPNGVQYGTKRPRTGRPTGLQMGVDHPKVPRTDRPKGSQMGIVGDQIPEVHGEAGGNGVSRQHRTSKFPKKIPKVHVEGGSGTSAQVKTSTKIPFVHPGGSGSGTNAQQHQRKITDWMWWLYDRVSGVIVLNRGWESCVTKPMIGDRHHDQVCIFMDPPYLTHKRNASLYHSDTAKESDRAAIESYEWCVKHGDRFKIAYCAHEGDFPVPNGWTSETESFSGSSTSNRDLIMFSPKCEDAGYLPLFDQM